MSAPDPNTGPAVSQLEIIQRAIDELFQETVNAPRGDLIRHELADAGERLARARMFVRRNIRDAEKQRRENGELMSREAQLAILKENGVRPQLPGRVVAILGGGGIPAAW